MEDDGLSDIQHEILAVIRRYDLKGLDNIRAHIQYHLPRRRTFHRAMARTAAGLYWDVGYKGGNDPVLNKIDEQVIIEEVKARSREFNCIFADELLDLVYKKKVDTITKAEEWLRQTQLEECIPFLPQATPPCRAYLNVFLDRHDVVLKNGYIVDKNRLTEGTHPALINNFFRNHRMEMLLSNQELIFNADECMIEPKKVCKVACPSDQHHAIIRPSPDVDHVTAMCCYSGSGQIVPLFIILKNLHNLPNELKELSMGTNGIVFASSENGYMTKDLFLAWCIHFITFLSYYRTTLPPNIRGNRAILYLDGHFSRYSPLAFWLLTNNNVEAIIFPPMVTHFMQPFDFAIAFTLKSTYDRTLRRLKYVVKRDDFNSERAWMRFLIVQAFMVSWNSIINSTIAKNSFRATGIAPYAPEIPLMSEFVDKNLTVNDEIPQSNNRGFDLGGQTMTILENIQALFNFCSDKAQTVSTKMENVNLDFKQLQTALFENTTGAGRLLTVFHPFILRQGVYYFDQ